MISNCLIRLRAVRLNTEGLLAGTADDELADHPFGYRWSVADILQHLANFDVHALAELVAATHVAAPHLDFSTAVSPSHAIAAFRAARTTLVDWVELLPAEKWATPLPRSSHPLLVGRSVSESLDFAGYHEARHADEIKRHLTTTRAAIKDKPAWSSRQADAAPSLFYGVSDCVEIATIARHSV